MEEAVDAKRKKFGHEENPSNQREDNTIATAGTSSENEADPHIFKLNVYCLEDLCEWLTKKELLAFRRTCKQIKSVVDVYIKLNYPRLSSVVIRNRADLSSLCYLQQKSSLFFEIIKHIQFFGELPNTEIDSIKPILNKLETLKLVNVKIDGDFYEVFLKHCPRLKCLSLIMSTTTTTIGTGNEWMLREYPTLEYFEIDIKGLHECPTLLEFFEKNPNIQTLSTNSKFLSMNYPQMLKSNIKFDRLNLRVPRDLDCIDDIVIGLNNQNFYQKLHLCVEAEESWTISKRNSKYVWQFQNIEMLAIFKPPRVPIPMMESIQQLVIGMTDFGSTYILEDMAKQFINLKCIICVEGLLFLHNFQALVCNAPKLEEVKVYSYIARGHVDEVNFSDFVAMNEKRKQLAGARKVKIYIGEKLFLKLKCCNANVNFSMIQLKRIESTEKEDLFNCIITRAKQEQSLGANRWHIGVFQGEMSRQKVKHT